MNHQEKNQMAEEAKKEIRVGIALLLLLGLPFLIAGFIFILFHWWIGVLPLFVGSILLIVTIRVIISGKRELKKAERIEEKGEWIEAEFVSAQKKPSVGSSHSNYEITCEYWNPQKGEKQVFREVVSIWIDPQVLAEQFGIHQLRVKVNQENREEYRIDASPFLEKIVDLTKI